MNKTDSLLEDLIRRMGGPRRFYRKVNDAIDELWITEKLPPDKKPSHLYPQLVQRWKQRNPPCPSTIYVRPVCLAARKDRINLQPADFQPEIFQAQDVLPIDAFFHEENCIRVSLAS